MATKINSPDLKVGMFVADLDRPWVDTPFLLQGFLIEDEAQIATLRTHCEFVIVDRARSVGDQFEAPAPSAANPAPLRRPLGSASPQQPAPAKPGASAAEPPPREAPPKPARQGKVLNLEDVTRRAGSRTPGAVPEEDDGEGMIGRMFRGLFGGRKEKGSAPPPPPRAEDPPETPQEYEARAALLPPGIQPQTYVNQTTVEEEAPRAREVVAQAGELLDKLVADIRIGQSFEVDRVEEIVDDMVESIVRNPQALMWVAKLREQDIGAYGHGLQVSVYLTSFGRHLGFPKTQLSQLAQIGLLLDIGKMRLPRAILDKQGRLTDDEFEAAKLHVEHGLEILKESGGFDPSILHGIEQHHERMNGSGYPRGLSGEEIQIFGRMSGIVDCFAA